MSDLQIIGEAILSLEFEGKSIRAALLHEIAEKASERGRTSEEIGALLDEMGIRNDGK